MADYVGGNTDMLNIGRSGGLGSGDFITGLLFGQIFDGGLGGKKGECASPATCKDVWKVDTDLFQTANETQDDIAEATSDIKDAISVVGDKVTNSTYVLNNSIKDLGYAQEKSTAEVKNLVTNGFTAIAGLIKETALGQENKALAKENAAQNAKLNQYELIQALKECKTTGNE